MKHCVSLLWILIFIAAPGLLQAHPFDRDTTSTQNQFEDAVKVYLDCDHCDEGYIKTHIKFVDYVRDQTDSEVHLMITSVHTASGGREYTLKFLGRKKFANQNDTLKYIANETDTRAKERRGLMNKIKMGLIPYISNTTLANFIQIKYNGDGKAHKQRNSDPWNHWVFDIDAGTYLSGEKTRDHLSSWGSVSAERVTSAWKIRFRFNGNYQHDKYEFSDGTSQTTHKNSESYHSLIAKSITPHWSVGVFSNAYSSTYRNIDFAAGLSPALEFNIFPYSEYSQHELSFLYRVTPNYNNYTTETIFNKTSEMLLDEQLSIHFDLTQPWGEIRSRIRGSHFFNDFSKNRLDFNSSFNIQVYRGLSVRFSGRYSLINDQISLSKEDVSDDEVLLNLRQQATSYSFGASVGLSYTFGSIYNNTVNPRF